MQSDFIIKLLGIKDRHVEVWDSGEDASGLWFELYTRVKSQKCLKCGCRTKRIHGYRIQTVETVALSEKPVTLKVHKRRYRCMECSHAFFEHLSFLGRYQRQTTMLTEKALLLTSELSFKNVSKMTGLSSNRIMRLFDRQPIATRRVLPRAIALDEFKGDAGGERFQTKVVDVEKKEVIDILPDRRTETIENYLKSCDTGNVEMVVIDLSKRFKESVQKALGSPLIIADRYHYMRQVYWAFDEVRREVQQELFKKYRIRMKRNKEVLWKSPSKLSEKGKKRVEEVLGHHTKLREAYVLKNKLDDWFKTSTHTNAKKGLEDWIQLAEESNLSSFNRVAKTMARWKQEIVQSFMYPYNNGYIEGVNNTTKVIKRISYGIKSFDRLRKKILWRQTIRSAEAS